MTKIALITGVTSGIGLATAKRFISLGYKVAGCARREDRLLKLGSELGKNFKGIKADLTNIDDIKRVFDECHEAFGKVDFLVNNAGIGYETSISEGDPSHWKEMIDLNVFALAMCSRMALDDMREKGEGHIINISSMSAHRVTLGGGVYAATKYAVRALTEGLRQELSAKKSNIRVTAISPGFVETEFYNSYYHDMKEEEKSSVYDDMKALQSGDIVDAIVYSLEAPTHVGINDILMRPLDQLS